MQVFIVMERSSLKSYSHRRTPDTPVAAYLNSEGANKYLEENGRTMHYLQTLEVEDSPSSWYLEAKDGPATETNITINGKPWNPDDLSRAVGQRVAEAVSRVDSEVETPKEGRFTD